LRQLNQALQALLPQPLSHRCRVANYRQGVLVIETANASWLLRLRYEQQRLLSAIRQHSLPALAAIEFMINPNFEIAGNPTTTRPVKRPTTCKPISVHSAQQLYLLAQRSPPNLRAILLKLAAMAHNPPPDSSA
jgi:hypothetical protein